MCLAATAVGASGTLQRTVGGRTPTPLTWGRRTKELVMDQEEAEEAAGAPSKAPAALELAPDTAGITKPAVREPALGSFSQDQGQGQDPSRREPRPNVSGEEEAQEDDEQGMEATSGTAKRPLETAQIQEPEQTDGLQGRMAQRFQLITKRGRHHARPGATGGSPTTKDSAQKEP